MEWLFFGTLVLLIAVLMLWHRDRGNMESEMQEFARNVRATYFGGPRARAVVRMRANTDKIVETTCIHGKQGARISKGVLRSPDCGGCAEFPACLTR